MDSSHQLLGQAFERHQQGRWDDAEALYRELLRLEPRHPDGLFLLGSLLLQRERVGSAVVMLRQALKQSPGRVEVMNNLGLAQARQGHFADAISLYEAALKAKPLYGDARLNLANAYRETGRFYDAARQYQQLLDAEPDRAEGWDGLALALRELNDLEGALAAATRATSSASPEPTFHNNRGAILKALGRFAEAVDAFDQALRWAPQFPEALSNRAVVLAQMGRLDEAFADGERAIQRQPNSAVAHNNLGMILHVMGRDGDAVGHFQQALRERPNFADAFNNLGTSLFAAGETDLAREAYEKAVELHPQQPLYWSNLGSVLEKSGAVEAAREALSRTASLSKFDPLWNLRLACLCPVVFPDNDAIDEYRGRLETELARAEEAILGSKEGFRDLDSLWAIDVRPPYNLQFHGRDERPLRQRFGALFERLVEPVPTPKPAGKPAVGFLVTHGHEWAFLRSIGGLFEHFRSTDWRPVIIASPSGIERFRAAIRQPTVEYLPLPSMAAPITNALRDASLDMLYHWEIATSTLNYLLPFQRLAPTQVTSWGIQLTSGIPAIGYYLSSDRIEIDRADAHYTEELVRLSTLMSYQRRLARPTRVRVRAEFGISEESNLYLCAQQWGKFQPDFDPVLREILETDPRARIVLTDGDNFSARRPLEARWEKTLGAERDRLVFLPKLVGDDYTSLVLLADVVLDPLYFGGVNTTYDAFSFGKVVVTCPSEFHRGRYTLGCYRSMGIDDAIVSSPRDYAPRAVKIANDEDYRKHLEQLIAERSEVLFEHRPSAFELEDWVLETAQRSRDEN